MTDIDKVLDAVWHVVTAHLTKGERTTKADFELVDG